MISVFSECKAIPKKTGIEVGDASGSLQKGMPGPRKLNRVTTGQFFPYSNFRSLGFQTRTHFLTTTMGARES